MHVFRGLPPAALWRDCALAIGNFDGVHRGHQALLHETARMAKELGLTSAVLTFEPHPREFFGHEVLSRISTLRDKLTAILACGIDRVYMLSFTQELAKLSPRDFARNILVDGLQTRWVTVGENFRFGDGARGDAQMLKTLGREMGYETYASPLLFQGPSKISSSRLREALARGDFHEAELMLGHPYWITGRVVHGAALGRTLGFPTLNQFVLPPGCHSQPAVRGVFAVHVRLSPKGPLYAGAASLGQKPTVSSTRRWNLETNVFDWHGDVYGKLARVEFVAKLRDEKKFSGLPELQAAIDHDTISARRILGLPD